MVSPAYIMYIIIHELLTDKSLKRVINADGNVTSLAIPS